MPRRIRALLPALLVLASLLGASGQTPAGYGLAVRSTDANGDAEDAYLAKIRLGGVAGRSGGDLSVAGDDRPAWVWGSLGAAIALVAGGLVLLLGVARSKAGGGA